MTLEFQARIKAGKTAQQAALLEPQFLKAVEKLMGQATFYLEGQAKVQAPVQTGFLRNSHISEVGFPISRVRVLANYGRYVHDGTRYIRANPWMQRARNDTVRWLRNQKISINVK